MAFLRTNKRENPFVQIDKTFTEDDRLSWGAKGLMSYILSRPDNWKIRREDLYKRSSDGRTKVENYITDLMEAGYIYYWSERNEDGTIKEWYYDVFESPDLNPYLEESIKKAKEMKEKRKEANKKKSAKKKKYSPDAEPRKVDNNPDAEPPDVAVPDVDNPDLVVPQYNNKDLKDTDFNNTNLNNNHHPIIPEFNQRQSDLIHEFKINKKLDDDEFNKLISRLKGKNFKHPAYIDKAYETMKNAIEPDKPKRTEMLPDWFDEPEQPEKPKGEDLEAQKAALKAKLDKLKGE